MDSQIRPSDFQKAWPHAMARAIHETASLAAQQELLGQKLDDQFNRLVQLAPLMAQMSKMLTERHEAAIRQATEDAVFRITQAQTALTEMQGNFLAAFEIERMALVKSREALDAQRLDTIQAQKRLDAARLDFNSMGLWTRVFKRA